MSAAQPPSARAYPRQRLLRFTGRHGIHRDACGVPRQDAIVARRDEPGGLILRSAIQERRQILHPPGIVDHQEAAPIIERVGQRGCGAVDGVKARPFAGEGLDQIGDTADQIVGLLAQRDAQNAVAEGILDVAVVTQGIGERGLAVAAGPAQRGRDRHRLAMRVKETLLERVERGGACDEALGQRIGHERHALFAGRPLEHLQQPRETLGSVDVVTICALHPARQSEKSSAPGMRPATLLPSAAPASTPAT